MSSYLILGLPTKQQVDKLNKLLGGKNHEKYRQTYLKNKLKRKR